MYNSIEYNYFKIEIDNPLFLFQKLKTNNHSEYIHWSEITKKIVRI